MTEEKCPTLQAGEWIIETDKGRLWGIDAWSFETQEDAAFEAMGDVYLSKEIKQLTSSNLDHYQKVLQEQWDSDTEL
ncbi:hypothetical protein MZM54_03630 [[Brevibacterium] frigoritolerans]|nr:hypothetical protein [Peribacillus frigoritolerans]